MSEVITDANPFFEVKAGVFIVPKLLSLEILFWTSISVFVLLAALSGIPIVGRIYAKLLLYIDGFIGMVASSDTVWKQPTDWSTSGIAKEGSKRIIFIRHGESVWNECFNNGLAKLPGNLAKRYLEEVAFYPTPQTVFLDTPLNKLGLQQALDLAEHLEKSPTSSIEDPALRDAIGCLRGDTPEDSLIVSSQLRRALATVGIALKKRLERTNEKILIHSACQEMSRNVDCMATSEPGCIPNMEGADCGRAAELMTKSNQDSYKADEIFNPALNGGHKPLNERGLDRILNFADWVFTRPEHTIIVGGHSLWFRNFFKAFLPLASQAHAKTCKMENGACVVFTLNVGKSATGTPAHWIESNSVRPIFKGFVLPKGSKKKD